jgi:hypothetical protein
MTEVVDPAGAAGAAELVLTETEIIRTADSIAAAQLRSGQIPAVPGGVADPWNHVEAAMALDVAGRSAEARAAYEWLRRCQNPDGSWYRGYRGDEVTDGVCESNFSAYLAVGLWHHYHLTGDEAYLHRMWPTLKRALDFVLTLQGPDGRIWWARDARGRPATEALLTGCASIQHSLRCGLAIAELRGAAQPDWELAAVTLGHLVARHPDRFAPRDRYSMDWYYPILSGALRGTAARRRLDAGWDRFVVPGLGVRCVSDRPWVTGAESAELVLALAALGDTARGAALLADIAHLRCPDGGYWTGYVYPDDAMWPEERTTWTAGAVLLADAMLAGEPATRAVFGGAGLPAGAALLPVCDDAACGADEDA